MYHTSLGDRILLGAERQLFCDCLGLTVDLVADNDEDFGLEAFDSLQRTQKLAVLYLAARGLLRPDQPPPKLTAYLEAAVAIVYSMIKSCVEQEVKFRIGDDDDTAWRERVLRAAREHRVSDRLPDVGCTDTDQWDWLIDCLSDRVLWDQDYALTATLDAAPEKRDEVHEMCGIADDYYTDIAPDPPAGQANLYLDAVRGLVG